MKQERGNFGSKLGMILAAAGSAVGLGNVWRFPTETGENGGGAFILLYIVCLLFFGLPVMVSEFVIGRSARLSAGFAYHHHAPTPLWRWFGRFQVLIPFLILCYYNVVAGWTLFYLVEAVRGTLDAVPAQAFAPFFADFTSNPWLQVGYFFAFMALTHAIVVQGVSKGIERFSKVLMPGLFIILLILVGCSLTMPKAQEAVDFLFTFDFSKITAHTVLAAMGQAFFSLSLGMGILSTYASYFKRDAVLGTSALTIAGVDTAVALLAGLMIFPAVFSVGVAPDEGPTLIFIALPSVFQSAFSSWPWLGTLFSIAFYALLVLATLTSSISIHEVVTAYITEATHCSRRKAASCVTIACFALGLLCALSFGPLKDVHLWGMTFFDLFDFVTAKLMLPISGFIISLFAAWRLSSTTWEAELTNDGTRRFPLRRLLFVMLRYVCPIGILLMFLNELGWMKLL